MMSELQPLWDALAGDGQHWIVRLMVWIGVARVLFKVVFTMLSELVKKTPSEKDNAWLDGILKSNTYAAVAFLFDWILSVKLPKLNPDSSKRLDR